MYESDRIDLENEMDLYNNYLEEAGINKDVWIGVNIFKGEYEVFVEKAGESNATYFFTFEDALQFCRTEFPDANWEAWD